MKAETKIEWCDYTINWWWGCEKVSPGCSDCYAEKFAKRVGDDIWGAGKPRRWIKSAVLEARKLNAKAEVDGVRYKVFCNSMSDFFETDHGQPIVNKSGQQLFTVNGDEFFTEGEYPECRNATLTDLRQQAFELIDECQHLDWLLVTKRPENIFDQWPQLATDIYQNRRPNVWLLTSVENQEQANKRIPELFMCRNLSPVLGLSMEPLLGPVDLRSVCIPEAMHGTGYKINWVITGGESGHNSRPMHPDWVRSIRDQCKDAGVPFFFKQWGEWYPIHGTGRPLIDDDEELCKFCWVDPSSASLSESGCEPQAVMIKVSKKTAGRLLDGVEHNGMPKRGKCE